MTVSLRFPPIADSLSHCLLNPVTNQTFFTDLIQSAVGIFGAIFFAAFLVGPVSAVIVAVAMPKFWNAESIVARKLRSGVTHQR
jgi:hypothetical protein